MLTLPPLSLYIHVPWCIRKCPYCDFNSHAVRGDLPEQEYLTCLLQDLREEQPFAQGREISSIFIGGGTPSLFSAATYASLFQQIDQIVPISPKAEITLEANPGTFEHDKFSAYRTAGINRLSIGVQSFKDEQLQHLGRVHNSEEAIKAISHAREVFDNLNLDLMHGLPGQTTQAAIQDLEQAFSLSPDHISWYQLTIEPNTEFHAKPPTLPVDETLWQIQEEGQQRLAEAGYNQYEISAYAQPGKQAFHNLNYWQFGDYLGIGAGAHGKITLPTEDRIVRRWKNKQPKAFMLGEQRLVGEQEIAAEERAFEFMLNALRLTEGVSSRLLTERAGLKSEDIFPELRQAQQKGLLQASDTEIRPTPQGRLFLNDLLGLFLE